LAWDFFESINRVISEEGNFVQLIDRNNHNTWNSTYWPASPGTGVTASRSVGQSKFNWTVRGNANVQKIFSKIWNTDDLITSYDGFGVFRPYQYNSDWKTKSGWWHVDQNGIKKPGKQCIQGMANFYPAGPNDGGLVVIPKSHLLFEDFFKERPQFCDYNDFVPMSKDEKLWNIVVEKNLKVHKVCCGPGDFICWDSRLIHNNAPAISTREPNGNDVELSRLVCYICMSPASKLISYEQYSKRFRSYMEGYTSTHWPEDCVLSGTPIAHYAPVELNENQKKLVPFPSYWPQEYREQWELFCQSS